MDIRLVVTRDFGAFAKGDVLTGEAARQALAEGRAGEVVRVANPPAAQAAQEGR